MSQLGSLIIFQYKLLLSSQPHAATEIPILSGVRKGLNNLHFTNILPGDTNFPPSLGTSGLTFIPFLSLHVKIFKSQRNINVHWWLITY